MPNYQLQKRRCWWILGTALLAFIAPLLLPAQGETTTGIVGTVLDPSGAAISGATVIALNRETGSTRTSKTDDAGRFNIPQLKPGPYSVSVQADSFESQTNSSVSSGLGQQQTVNFTLQVATAKGEVTVAGQPPIINPDNPNTASTLTARQMENLPNPGGDMTYPMQFAPGALINTAGSGNDFVGGTNGYGNAEFNCNSSDLI